MKKKTSKTTKPMNEKKPLKKTGNKKKETKKPPQKPKKEVKKEPEVVEKVPEESQEPIIEEAPPQIIEVPKVKTYEIDSDEDITYILNLEQVKDKLKINVKEKDSFPQNEYENYFTLDDLVNIDKWFKIFYNVENLIAQLDQLTKNENVAFERKKKDVLSLYINFPIDLLERIEIPLPINEIDNKDLFFQLISKISEIESKEKNEIVAMDEKMDNLEHLISNMEQNNQEEEHTQEHQENDNLNENIDMNQNNENNLEEMKDALKQQIKNNIENANEKGENEHEKMSQENSYNQEVKSKNEYLLIDQNQIPFHESTIISGDSQEKEKEIELILEWLSPSLGSLPNPPHVLRTKLVYKAEVDGDKASTFHEKCDNLGPTITLIQTKEGFRYGGYTSVSWEGPENSEFKSDAEAFIFSLDTQKKYESLDPDKSIQCSAFWGPYFGEGGTICVPDNFYEESNAFYKWPSTYNLSEKYELTLGQECNINIKDYEVYAFELNSEEPLEQEQEEGQGEGQEEGQEEGQAEGQE